MKCFSLWFAALFYYMLCIRALHAPTDGKCIFGIHLPNRTVYNFSSAVQKNGFFFVHLVSVVELLDARVWEFLFTSSNNF